MKRRNFVGGIFIFSILPVAKIFESLGKVRTVLRHSVEYSRVDGGLIDFFQVEADMKSWVNTDRYMSVFKSFRESGRIVNFHDFLTPTKRTFAFDFRTQEDLDAFLALVRPHANHKLREDLGYAMSVNSSWV